MKNKTKIKFRFMLNNGQIISDEKDLSFESFLRAFEDSNCKFMRFDNGKTTTIVNKEHISVFVYEGDL